MGVRKCAYCPGALREGARADARYCSARCRDAVYRERKQDAAPWLVPKRSPSSDEIPFHAWLIFALEVRNAAPSHAASYRLTWVGTGTRWTIPPSGALGLKPFQPPKRVPAEGRYRATWLDEHGEEIAPENEFTVWLSV